MACLIGYVFLIAALLICSIALLREKRRCVEYEINLSETERILKEFRKIRHQYNNMLQSVIFFIENEQWGQFQDFKEEILKCTASINSKDELQLLKIKIYKLRRLVSGMAEQAAGLGINLEVSVPQDIEHVNLNEAALFRALRFLFDRNFEEVKKSGRKEISLQISSTDEGVEFLLNSSLDSRPDSGWLNKKEFQRIISRHKNVIFNDYIESDYYVQELMIMLGS